MTHDAPAEESTTEQFLQAPQKSNSPIIQYILDHPIQELHLFKSVKQIDGAITRCIKSIGHDLNSQLKFTEETIQVPSASFMVSMENEWISLIRRKLHQGRPWSKGFLEAITAEYASMMDKKIEEFNAQLMAAKAKAASESTVPVSLVEETPQVPM